MARRPPPDRRLLRVGLVITVLAQLAVVGLVARANLRARHHPGFTDLRNPLAEAWSPDPRAEYGWPLTARRVFDHPTRVNAPGRWDRLGLLVDGLVGLALLALCLAPLCLFWWRSRRAA